MKTMNYSIYTIKLFYKQHNFYIVKTNIMAYAQSYRSLPAPSSRILYPLDPDLHIKKYYSDILWK